MKLRDSLWENDMEYSLQLFPVDEKNIDELWNAFRSRLKG